MSISPPVKIAVPFGTGGLKNTIPAAADPVTGNAGYSGGFPAINMTPKVAGGIPPFGEDFNGIFFDVTTAIQFLEAGGSFPYDSAYATAVGGYPIGALVSRTDSSGLWRNTLANNTTDPEVFGAGWQPEDAGITSVAMTNSNVTLTALQAAKSIITITGVLTANLQLVFPAYQKQWLIVNNATGAFTVTCKTSAGSGVGISTGISQKVYGDGTNIAVPTDQSGGAFTNLRSSATGLSALVTITADSVTVFNTVGDQKKLLSVSVTPSLAASGANGLDTGTSAASTWYAEYVIWNPSTLTVAGLFSLSGTSPTMPSGYTYKFRTGWTRSDPTGNKFPLSYQQFGPDFGYKIAGNVANVPVLSSGTAGSIAGSPATWIAATVSNAVPTTASVIRLFLSITSGSSGTAISAPNPLFGGVGGNPSTPHVVSGAAASPMASEANYVIEGTNVYYASNAAAAVMNCLGWTDNL